MNKKANKSQKSPKSEDYAFKSAHCEGNSCILLPIGSKVLAIIEEPKDIEGKRLPGKFRSTDIRYELKIRTIEQIITKPMSPPLYILDGNKGRMKMDSIGYTKNQLLPISEKEMEILKKLKQNQPK